MLTVIFGAGASYDSCTDYIANEYVSKRIPMAKDLFSLQFAHVAQRHKECEPLLYRLRNAVPNIEDELEMIFNEQESYPRTRTQLFAIRAYLDNLISEKQVDWNRATFSHSTYRPFINNIDKWKHIIGKTNNLTTFITFNYDTLLDEAYRDILKYELPSLLEYVSTSRSYRLLHPHGSIEWARLVTFNPKNGNRAIRNTEELIWTDHYSIKGAQITPEEGMESVPAIAVPTKTKSSFEMPSYHVDSMIDAIKRTTVLLIIGWRATEKHFLKLWKLHSNPQTMKMIYIVNINPTNAKEISERLKSDGGITCENVHNFYKGFSRFVQSDLNKFLEMASQYEY